MEAMDVDVDVDEGGPSQQLALIRAVRTLDEDSSSTLPEKVHKLWLLLTAAKNTRLHGVEESILRWLLKQMSGNTDNAEHVRRHPLAWKILGHVFPKVPAQALGRSLAYLRFVSILSRTLGDVTQEAQTSTPGTEGGGTATKKRKRGTDWPTAIEELRTSAGCLRTASEVFEALAILLDQGASQSSEVTPEKRVGAEHIKSLFSSSSDETRDITAKLLLICDNSLTLSDAEFVKGQQTWINVLAAVWNLRLHSKEDSLEFAKHIYERASLILAKIGVDISSHPSNCLHNTRREIWTSQLRGFLSTYFIRPARQRFAQDKSVDMLKLALQLAQTDVVASTTVMWSIAATAPRDTSDPKSKIEHDAWAETIFQVTLRALRPLDRRRKNEVLSRLVGIALQTRSIPDTETLRLVYEQHALDGIETDWKLLSKILACDADVFLAAQDSGTIFDNISRVSISETNVKDDVVSNVVLPLQNAYANARDLAGFVVRWFRSLCAAESVEQSVWFDQRIRQHLATILQTAFSSSQLLRLLEDLESIPSKAGELLVVLDGICAGLTDESTIANVSSKVMSIMGQEWSNTSPDVLALRWRVFGYLASWGTSDECKKLWKRVKSDMKQILKKSPLDAAETFEVFSCCYKLSLSNHIAGKYEEDLAKLICTMVGRLVSSAKTEADLLPVKPYMQLVFHHLPRLSEQPKQEVNTLTDQIIELFWRVSYELPSLPNERRLEYVRPLIHNYDVADEELMVDALMAPFLDALDNSENQCGWTQSHSFNLLSILLEFPVEIWTRSRRKRVMASWKKHKSEINSYAVKNPKYYLAVLRLLVKIMQQPTFYEGMDFNDLIDICSGLTTSDTTLLSLAEKFVDTTIGQMFTNMNELTQSYLLNASEYVEGLKSKKGPLACPQILLLKSFTAALHGHKSSHEALQSLGIDINVFEQNLAKAVQRTLIDLASEEQGPSPTSLTNERVQFLSLVLDAAQLIGSDPAYQVKFKLPGDTLTRLDRVGNSTILRNPAIVWKLRSFLIKQSPDRHTAESFSAVLDEDVNGVEEETLYNFVDAYVQRKSQSVRGQLLSELMAHDKLIGGSIGSLVAARRLLELHPGPNVGDKSANAGETLDLAKVHDHFTSYLNRTESLPHFKQIVEAILFLLDKHASAMTQYNIEATLASVVEVCSAHGPKIQGSKAAGEIFAGLFKLVALIIKRHRLRINGHFHILLKTLRSLLTVLLSDPSPSSSLSRRQSAQQQRPRHPPWLQARLQPRHAERFARLLTLICEPSAASVARARSGYGLDSATDLAKRAASRHMYLILEVYVKLQLEGEVALEMRKALEVGVFAVLDITSEGCRKVLNESLDAAGRAVFRALFGEYRKFGKWKGV